MVNVNDFKAGMTIQHEGNIYIVMDFQHVKPGKGAAIVKAKLKNLRTGSIAEYTFNAGVKVESARIEKKTKSFKIPMESLHWYAAFHNESHHPHVHLMVYSDRSQKP